MDQNSDGPGTSVTEDTARLFANLTTQRYQVSTKAASRRCRVLPHYGHIIASIDARCALRADVHKYLLYDSVGQCG